MHVQFIGIPASGKTSIVNDLIKTFPHKYIRGKKAYSSFTKMALNCPLVVIESIWFCLPILPLCFRAVIKSDVNKKNKFVAIFGLFVNIGNFLLFSRATESKNRIILWDELMYQRALSIFAYSTITPKNSVIIKYIKWADKKFRVFPVFVFCDLENNQKRLLKRGLPERMKYIVSNKVIPVIETQFKTVLVLKENVPDSISIISDLSIQENTKILNEYFSH